MRYKKHKTLNFIVNTLFAITSGLSIMIVVIASGTAHADTVNPCEYMNSNATQMRRIDTGNDASWVAQEQYRNREMVTACQDYEIKMLNNMKNNINKDRSDGYTGYQSEY